MTRCKFDRSNKGGVTYEKPCRVCGLGIMRALRDDCPYRKLEGKLAVLIKRHLAYYEGIGLALKDVRKYRSTGEPALSDREEIERLKGRKS
jgi:hypothetical protein